MRRIVLPLALLLAGCAFGHPETTTWERAETTPEATAGDLQACRHAAEAQVVQDQQANQDMGADPTSQGTLASNLGQYQAENRLNTLLSDCMRTLGYHAADKSAP